jgi:predicted Zn-dependent peptidase
MKRRILFILLMITVSCTQYRYETVEKDPLKVRIYTLANGLKAYMSVNKDQARIQASIVVKAGSMYDPVETTGMAHYFEHLMFNGTKKSGTLNYDEEAPILAEIEDTNRQFVSKSCNIRFTRRI